MLAAKVVSAASSATSFQDEWGDVRWFGGEARGGAELVRSAIAVENADGVDAVGTCGVDVVLPVADHDGVMVVEVCERAAEGDGLGDDLVEAPTGDDVEEGAEARGGECLLGERLNLWR